MRHQEIDGEYGARTWEVSDTARVYIRIYYAFGPIDFST